MNKKTLFYIISTIFLLLTFENLSSLLLTHKFKNHLKIRDMVLNQKTNQYQNSVPQAYLLYSPAPNYKKGMLSHNYQGFRGKSLSIKRLTNEIRILFLGGSTTYGYAINNDELTYPEQLKQKLQKIRPHMKISTINAGLPWGTSAELLTHYIFKFSYFKPDIVIINTGGNDAEAQVLNKTYMPDYSHWRQQFTIHTNWSSFGSFLLRSSFLSLFILPTVYGLNPEIPTFVNLNNKTNTKWYDSDTSKASKDSLAFKKNIENLINLIKLNGSKVILMPFKEAPTSNAPIQYKKEVLKNERILKEIGIKMNVEYVPFPQNVKNEYWVDTCHLNSDGAEVKANSFLKTLLKIIPN